MNETPKRRRLPAEARREEILDTATRLVAERGYNGITIQEVADACGLAKSGVLHHFPSKTVLLVELLKYRDEHDLTAEEVRSAANLDRASSRSLIDRVVRRNFERRELIRMYTVLGSEALDPAHPAHDYFERRLRDSRRLFRDAASGWQSDPDSVALRMIAFLEGLQSLWLRDPSIPFLRLWAEYADQAFAESPRD